jgi:hypothetical protein
MLSLYLHVARVNVARVDHTDVAAAYGAQVFVHDVASCSLQLLNDSSYGARSICATLTSASVLAYRS